MIVADLDKVHYCNVARKVNGRSEILLGLAYEGRLFVEGESFRKDQGNEAIRRSREVFLETKGKTHCLVIEDKAGFTLWYEDENLKVIKTSSPASSDLVTTIDLEKLVAQMRNVGGVLIKDRRYHLKVYPRCFVGSEAVEWLCRRFQVTKEGAVRIGQRLIDEGWVHHVTDDHAFADDYLFYRFYWDELS